MTAPLIITTPDELDRVVKRAVAAAMEAKAGPVTKYVTVAEAARIRGVDVNTIYRWAKDGLIKSRGGRGTGCRMEVLV